MAKGPKLLGCPFCGHPPVVEPTRPDVEGDGWAMVRCGNPKCNVDVEASAYGEGHAASVRAAARRWNRRATP